MESAYTEVKSSLVSLEALLVGREKLYDIAVSALRNPVDPRKWLYNEDTTFFADQLDALDFLRIQ